MNVENEAKCHSESCKQDKALKLFMCMIFGSYTLLPSSNSVLSVEKDIASSNLPECMGESVGTPCRYTVEHMHENQYRC